MTVSKTKAVFALSVTVVVVVFGIAVESYDYLRHEYHTETLTVQVTWSDDSFEYDDLKGRPVIYWAGIRGEVVPSDYIAVLPDAIRHESGLYHRDIWIDAEVIPNIKKVRLCIGDRFQEFTRRDLSDLTARDISLGTGNTNEVNVVRLQSERLSLSSAVAYFDGIINWRGDGRLVATVTVFIFVMLSPVAALLLLLFFLARSLSTAYSSGGPRLERGHVWGALALVFIIALGVRLVGLANLDPHIDEYAHTSAALQLLNGTWPNYTRGIVVTLAISGAYFLFGTSSLTELIAIGAVPGVFVSSLTILPVFALGRRISPSVGIIAALLWAISPWAIGMAHWMREYAYFPFLVLAFLLAIVRIFEILLSGVKGRIIPLFFWLSVFLGYSWYAFLIDTVSTLRVGFLFGALISIGLIIEHRQSILLQCKTRPKLLAALFVPGIVLAYIVWSYATGQSQLTLRPESADWRWFHGVFAGSQPLQWWNGSSVFFWPAVFVFVSYVVITWTQRQRTRYLLTWLIVFAGVLFFYVFFFDRYFNARYIFYVLPILCLLFAVVLDGLWDFVLQQRGKWFRPAVLACAIILTLQLVNPVNTWTAMTTTEHGTTFTDNFQPRVRGVICFLRGHVREETTIIETHLRTPLQVTGLGDIASVHGYSSGSDDRFEQVASIVAENPDHGFMILDVKRGGEWEEGFPTAHDFRLADTRVRTLGQLDQFYIYIWGDHDESGVELQNAMRECAVDFEYPN